MKFKEAYKLMKEGKAVARPDWFEGVYWILDGDDIYEKPICFSNEIVKITKMYSSSGIADNIIAEDWMEVDIIELSQVVTGNLSFVDAWKLSKATQMPMMLFDSSGKAITKPFVPTPLYRVLVCDGSVEYTNPGFSIPIPIYSIGENSWGVLKNETT